MKTNFSKIILIVTVFLFVFAFSACKNNAGSKVTATSETSRAVVTAETTAAEITTAVPVETTAESSATETIAPAPLKETTAGTTNPSAANPGTTKKQAEYLEWTYNNKSGTPITYSENPENKFIAAAAKQLNLKPNRLSSIFYLKDNIFIDDEYKATVLVFSTSNKSRETIETCYFLDTDEMKVEKAIWEMEGLKKDQADKLKSKMKDLAVGMYDEAYKHKTN